MKIWQVGAASSPYRIDGVSRTVWLLAREQARLGHDVSIVIDTPPDQAAIEMAREVGMKLIHVEAGFRGYNHEIRRIIRQERPQLVHMHSVFIYRQATLGKALRDFGIPYVITPHAGFAPQVLRRGFIKKTLYTWLRERPRVMGAAAITLVTPPEELAIRSFAPDYNRPIRWIPNPVEVDNVESHRWQGVHEPKRIIFLGRFDVLVKGIDILVEIGRLLPEVQFDLYGTEDARTLDWLNRLKQDLPTNVTFHNPVYGMEKTKILSRASFYLQPSRWEGFPISVAECLYTGVPVAIADTLDLAQLFSQYNLGLVFPLDPPAAAVQIRKALADQASLHEWSRRGQEFAMENFHPTASAQRHLKLYEQILADQIRSSEADYSEVSLPQPSEQAPVANGETNGHAIRKRWQIMPAYLRSSVKHNVSQMVQRTNRVFGPPELPRTIVLCYHSINRAHADLSIDPLVFREQIIALREMGFEFLNFSGLTDRLLRWGPPKNNVACITFDDGYEDNLTQAAPILNELDVPATTFVTTGLMNHEEGVLDYFSALTHYKTTYLSARQVGELHRAGFEIGAHTHTHANMAGLSLPRAREEVFQSKSLLEDAIGQRVVSFAYPFGKRNIHYTPATVSIVRESGFVGAASIAFRAVTTSESVRIFEVPRFFVNRSDTHASFVQKVKGHYDWLGSIQEQTPAWIKAKVSPEDRY